MAIILSPRDAAKLTFPCISLKRIGGDVNHDAVDRRSNLRYCSSVIVRFTARTPLQRSRGHPIAVQVSEALRSMGIRGILPFSRRQGPGACRRICLPFAPSLGAEVGRQRYFHETRNSHPIAQVATAARTQSKSIGLTQCFHRRVR